MTNGFNLEILQVGLLGTNCYLVSDPRTSQTLVIDPGAEHERIIKTIKTKKLLPQAIVNTHGHADHTAANSAIKKSFGIDIYIHEADAPFLKDPVLNGSHLLPEAMLSSSRADVLLKDGSRITVGGLVFKVIHTPGHTPGGICLAVENSIFTGDTLFRGDIGRCDLPGGDEEAMMKSLMIFRTFPGKTLIYPGHGPSSTLDREFSENQYLA